MKSDLFKLKQPIKSETTLESIYAELLQINDIRQILNTLEIETATNKILNYVPYNKEQEIYKFKPGEK